MWQPRLGWCRRRNKPSRSPQRLPQAEPSVVSRSKWGKPKEFSSSCAVWMERATPRRNWKTFFSTRCAEDAIPRLGMPLPLVYFRLYKFWPSSVTRNETIKVVLLILNYYLYKTFSCLHIWLAKFSSTVLIQTFDAKLKLKVSWTALGKILYLPIS